jgi:hypothetical protein
MEALEMEELEEEWVDEGVWVEGGAEDFDRRMFLCNICSHARDVPGLPRDESQKPGTARQKPPRDDQDEIFSRSHPVPSRAHHYGFPVHVSALPSLGIPPGPFILLLSSSICFPPPF